MPTRPCAHLLKFSHPYGAIRGTRLHETQLVEIQIEARVIAKLLGIELIIVRRYHRGIGARENGKLKDDRGDLHGWRQRADADPLTATTRRQLEPRTIHASAARVAIAWQPVTLAQFESDFLTLTTARFRRSYILDAIHHVEGSSNGSRAGRGAFYAKIFSNFDL